MKPDQIRTTVAAESWEVVRTGLFIGIQLTCPGKEMHMGLSELFKSSFIECVIWECVNGDAPEVLCFKCMVVVGKALSLARFLSVLKQNTVCKYSHLNREIKADTY